jgi:hypothetical protein
MRINVTFADGRSVEASAEPSWTARQLKKELAQKESGADAMKVGNIWI